VDFTPVSEGERRIQSSKYKYTPNLQLLQITEANKKKDAKGCNGAKKVAGVSCVQKKKQDSRGTASYDTGKTGVAVCNTKCASQGTGINQGNSAGKSGRSFTKENTIKASSMLVSEGNSLKLRGASENSVLDNSTLHLNTKANRNHKELEISLTHDSLMCSSRSSGIESELNVPTCPDSAQKMIDDDKFNEKQTERKDLSRIKQNMLHKEGKINAKSIEGENGEMVDYPIHESLLDEREEVQWISNRHILKDWSVMEQLSCGISQDKDKSEKSSSELNIGESYDKQSLMKNDNSSYKGTPHPKAQFSDESTFTKSLSQISYLKGSESHSHGHDNSSNGEDISLGKNRHNILKLKHNIDDYQNDVGKLSENVPNDGEKIDEECIEKHLNINLMQLCKEKRNNSSRRGTDDNKENGNDVQVPDTHKIYGKNIGHLNCTNSIKDIMNDSIFILKDNQLGNPEFISLRADGKQWESGTGDAEHGSKETPGTRILSVNNRTTGDTCHGIVLAQPDPAVGKAKVSYLPAEKEVPSVRQNGYTVCTELGEKESSGPLPTNSGMKSGQSQIQATLQNGLGTGQTKRTVCNSMSSLTSGRKNPNRKFSFSRQVTKNDGKLLSQTDSSLWKSGKNAIIENCKPNEDCISSTCAKEMILDQLSSEREDPINEPCHTVHMLGQTDVSNNVLHEQVPENITANMGQPSLEESSFCCSSQEPASPLWSSLLPPEESSCSQKGKFFKFL
jgi:hypothetical protein